jgi:hypothetical protein
MPFVIPFELFMSLIKKSQQEGLAGIFVGLDLPYERYFSTGV